MRTEFRTLARAISTLVVLFVLVFGASLEVLAHQKRGRDWGRGHNRGRHLGWERGRRVGQNRDNWRWRRATWRDRRLQRRAIRRERRRDRRSFFGSDRSLLQSRFRQERADLRLRHRSDRDFFKQSRGGRGRH